MLSILENIIFILLNLSQSFNLIIYVQLLYILFRFYKVGTNVK